MTRAEILIFLTCDKRNDRIFIGLSTKRAFIASIILTVFNYCFWVTQAHSEDWFYFGEEAAEFDQPQKTLEPSPPNWNFLRFEEDWLAMKEIPKFHKTGLFDPVKHIPLSGDESLWVSFGGRVRFRSETWSDFSFSEANDDTFLLTRVFLHSDLHWGDLLRVFVEGKTAHSIGRDLPGGRRTLDVDNVELQQAFLDIRIPLGGKNVITLRPGRREMLKGKQRLISPLPWGNTLRHWDGVSGILELAEWNIENFLDPVCPGAKIWFQ